MKKTEHIFGLHAVSAALKHDPEHVQTIWADASRQDQRLRNLLDEARARHIEIQKLSRQELNKLCNNARHQGIVAAYQSASGAHSEHDIDNILAGLSEPALLLVLDGVQDPHNLGACLRTADAAGVHALISPADRAVGLTPTVRKIASGAAETVPFIQATNLARTLRSLREQGLWLIGTDDSSESSVFDIDFTAPSVIVMGAEGKGLRRLTRELCDHLVRIPMAGSVESLNVSVATGVVLFEAVRQRLQRR